jgi:hypothetical protein
VQKRTNSGFGISENAQVVVVRGIQRACYLASIEVTNFFMTGYIWWAVAIGAIALAVLTLKIATLIGLRTSARDLGLVSDGKYRKHVGRCYRIQHKGIMFRWVSVFAGNGSC